MTNTVYWLVLGGFCGVGCSIWWSLDWLAFSVGRRLARVEETVLAIREAQVDRALKEELK